MTAFTESQVQLAPDSTGKKIRNIAVEAYILDATTGRPVLTTVLMQVTSLADESGNIISDFIDYEYQQRVIELLEQIRDGISELIEEHVGD